ncbi:hypothetical protein Tco_1182534 [Tanacetum coccineum]
MGDTIAQTRLENVSKLSNDLLLARGNTLRSGEDSLKLNELMELCTNLQQKVLDLETTKTTQANEIVSLKRRVKKLEKKDKSRTHKLKRLYKGRRIHDIDADEDITLVNDDNKIFDMDALAGEEVFVAEQSGNVVEEVVVVIDAASIIPVSFATITDVEITLAQALVELKSAKPKADKVVIQEPEHGTTITTPTTIIHVPKPPQDKGKGIMIEEPMVEQVKPMKRLEQIRLDEELAFKLQAEEEEERLAKEKAQQIEEANIAWDDVQAKVKADYQLAQRLQAQEEKELTDEEKARLFVQLLKQRRKHFVAKRAEEKRNRPPTRAQQRIIMCTYLKNMEGWKPKSLKNKSFANIQELFEKAMKRVNTFVDYRTELLEESSKKAKIELEENLKKAEAEVMEGSSKRACTELEQENEEEVAIDVVPLATKPPTIVDWKIHKEGNNNYYQIIRADGSSKMYMVFSQILKIFDMQYLEDLYKLVKSKYGSTRPVEDLDLILYVDLKTMFDPHVEDQIWKNQQDYRVLNWKLYDSCGVHSSRMQHVFIHMLVEKRYPLTPATITDMLNKKLQGRIVGIKRLLDNLRVTAAQVCVTAAKLNSGLVTNPIPQQPCNPPPRDDWDRLFQPMFDEYFNPPTIVVSLVPVAAAPRAVDLADSPMSTSIDQDAPSTNTPMVEKNKLDEDLQGTPVDATLYRGMIGSLMYLTSNADHAGCQDTRCITSGSAQFLGDKLVSWSSKKQKSTAISNYGFQFNKIPLYCDNKSAIALCCNNIQLSRAKHIDVRYHFIKERVENGIVELYFVWTEYHLADIFTKPLSRERFNFLIEKLVESLQAVETLQWENILTVGSSSNSGNHSTNSGNPLAFYSQQSSPKLDTSPSYQVSRIK